MNEPEFKLYYDTFGKVLFYSCDMHEGDYLVIDAMTYAEGRFDVQVVDGKIEPIKYTSTIFKLAKDTTGTKCPVEDITIIANEKLTNNSIGSTFKIANSG